MDDGATRIEGGGGGEPAAKRLKAAEVAATRNLSALGGRLIQVKWDRARVFRNLKVLMLTMQLDCRRPHT